MGAPTPVSARTTLVGSAPGPAAASALFGTDSPAANIAASPSAASPSITVLTPAPSTAASTTAPNDDDDGFGDDAEPGSPLSALANVLSAPTPAAAASPAATDVASAQTTTIPDGDAGILDDDFVIARPPNVLQNLIATLTSSRRNMAIAAGAAGLLVIVSALAFCGGGSSSKRQQVVASEPTDHKKATAQPEPVHPVEVAKPATEPVEPAPTPVPAEPTEASGPTAEELAAVAAPGDPPREAGPKRDTGKAAATTSAAAATTPANTTASSGGKKLGGKQVVLEYDTQARESKTVASAPTSDQAAIQKARGAYASGNQRLFAGDANGAIKFYRQSLGFYPGYVAGYRGLGLAYAQQGDKPRALQALRMYVGSVPTAKDAPLIRKRISSLQSK